MRRSILILSVFLLVFGCLGGQPPQENVSQNISPHGEGPPVSECDSYSEGPRKVICYAMEREDMSMCAQIDGGPFLEECVLIMAELLYNESNLQYCGLSQVEGYQKTCQALVLEDPEKCFEFGTGEGMGAGIIVRDCIGLVARKMRDPSLCDLHVSRAQTIYDICGHIQDCENQFTGTGAEYNADVCRANVEAAMEG